jgi:hypothetical protein
MPYRLSNTASTGASKNQGTEIVSSNSLATAAREKQALADRLDGNLFFYPLGHF